MSRLRLISAGLLVFLAFLLWRAPAWLVTDRVIDAVPELRLGQTKGTLWSGELDQVAYQGIHVAAVGWRFRPLGLISGLPLHVSAAAPAKVSANLGSGGGGKLRITDLDIEGDIATLLGAAGLPTMGFGGRYSGNVDEALISTSTCEAISGRLVLESLQGDVAGIEKVAPVVAQISCQGGAVVVQIDEANTMRVRGTLRLRIGGAVNGQVVLSPPPGSELFSSLSQLMGRPRNGKDFLLRL